MFGRNEIVGRKYFDVPEAAEGQLYVTSMFMTLQGEGPLRGEPAFFLRLAKCNLACGFCDTYFEGGDWRSPEDIEVLIDQRLHSFFNGRVPAWARYEPTVYGDMRTVLGPQYRPRQMALVVTGGEPMLQTNLGPFLDKMKQQFTKLQIETNGTQWQPLPDGVIVVCSPKCIEREGRPIRYLQPHPQILERADCLKFVMCAFDTDPEGVEPNPYNTVPEWAHEWRWRTGRPVFISPMNIYRGEPKKSRELRAQAEGHQLSQAEREAEEVVSFWEPGLLNMEANKRNHEYAARYAVEHGFTFNLQAHLFASLA